MSNVSGLLDRAIGGEAFRDDPYRVWNEVRDRTPVHFSEVLRAWIVARHVDVELALGDPRLSSAAGIGALLIGVAPELQPLLRSFVEQTRRSALFLDPPDHSRVRRFLARGVAPARVEALRGGMEALAVRSVKNWRRGAPIDARREVSLSFPAQVLCLLLGVPLDDWLRLRRWTDDQVAVIARPSPTEHAILRAMESLRNEDAYLRDQVSLRRSAPGDDLISILVSPDETGAYLHEEEVIANCAQLLVAGHETTSNLIANGLHALGAHPDQFERLRADPALLRTAINEFLRYEPPVPLLIRTATTDVEIGQTRIGAGEVVLLCLAAANRDPAVFDEPNALKLDRSAGRVLAFGYGPHMCVGAQLARMEAQVLFRTILDRCRGWRMEVGPARWSPNMTPRALLELPITWH